MKVATNGGHVEAWSPLELIGLKSEGHYLGDAELEIDALLAAGLVAYYAVVVSALQLKSNKQKAWVVTSCSASTCTVFFFVGLCNGDLGPVAEFMPVSYDLMMDTRFSRFCSRYFRVTLAVDLALGVVAYRDQLDFLTSWFHHTAYFLLMNWCISRRVTLTFMLFLVEEFPTLLLALGSIDKRLRTNYIFGASFFLLRVAYHGAHFYAVFMLWNRDDQGKVDMTRAMMMLTMSLHLYWFSGWIRQQLRKRKSTAKQIKSS